MKKGIDIMKEGLEEAIKIIDKEMELAKQINPVMALGMDQIKDLIIRRLKLEFVKED
ncbi:hypothetical protein [Clostridium botulinum]|uniref:hypothetical protein n=1 Tax=Clostridium botulinum TaxID=1491 RepID=UPI00192A6C71|nr:hypothetical protein [Clostridium botulinum]NCI20621.1 hypothetical protein [Clostridium botulinum]NCI72078.1 hypothetical protein [Clostridium botulinum]